MYLALTKMSETFYLTSSYHFVKLEAPRDTLWPHRQMALFVDFARALHMAGDPLQFSFKIEAF